MNRLYSSAGLYLAVHVEINGLIVPKYVHSEVEVL